MAPTQAVRPRRPAARRRAGRPAAAAPTRLIVRGLAARTILGVRPDERRKRQDVLIDLALDVRVRAGRTDRLADAVDYKRVKDAVLAHVESSRHRLLEALAESVAALCLRVPGVEAVEVTVDKPGALRFARSVAVHVRRERGGEAP